MSLFRCPLCAAPLTREPGAYRCPEGHSFDVAREGYVHLLPPNQKHSAAPRGRPGHGAGPPGLPIQRVLPAITKYAL